MPQVLSSALQLPCAARHSWRGATVLPCLSPLDTPKWRGLYFPRISLKNQSEIASVAIQHRCAIQRSGAFSAPDAGAIQTVRRSTPCWGRAWRSHENVIKMTEQVMAESDENTQPSA